jgi:hypothetical protein
MTESDEPKFSVIVIEERTEGRVRRLIEGDMVFPPTVYFVDWGKGKLAEVDVHTREPPAQVDTRWECERTD